MSVSAADVDAVTFEFENVPAVVADVAERLVPVRPGKNVLHVCQHRLREKNTLREAGLPVPQFAAVRSLEELRAAADSIGRPAVLKTASSGYDGKGQAKITVESELASVWKELDTEEAIYEAFVSFEKEVSVIGVRGMDGSMAFYGPIENEHSHHILDISHCPADVPPSVRKDAIEIARAVLETLDVVGVLCVELFVKEDGALLINELAPRPHNSGHLTIEAFATSQFEQQVRAVAGLPLGSSRAVASCGDGRTCSEMSGSRTSHGGTEHSLFPAFLSTFTASPRRSRGVKWVTSLPRPKRPTKPCSG